MKFSIGGLFALTAAVAAVFGTYVTFWDYGQQEYVLWLGFHLIANSLVTMACFSQFAALRSAFRATAIFGWAYFFFVLHAGLVPENAVRSKIGLAMMGTCFLIALAAITLARPIQGQKGAEGS